MPSPVGSLCVHCPQQSPEPPSPRHSSLSFHDRRVLCLQDQIRKCLLSYIFSLGDFTPTPLWLYATCLLMTPGFCPCLLPLLNHMLYAHNLLLPWRSGLAHSLLLRHLQLLRLEDDFCHSALCPETWDCAQCPCVLCMCCPSSQLALPPSPKKVLEPPVCPSHHQ